jgi:hypothetical protein
MKNKVVLAFAIIALLSIGAWTGYAQKDKRSRVGYEYWVIADPTETSGMDDGINKLNQLGPKAGRSLALLMATFTLNARNDRHVP